MFSSDRARRDLLDTLLLRVSPSNEGLFTCRLGDDFRRKLFIFIYVRLFGSPCRPIATRRLVDDLSSTIRFSQILGSTVSTGLWAPSPRADDLRFLRRRPHDFTCWGAGYDVSRRN